MTCILLGAGSSFIHREDRAEGGKASAESSSLVAWCLLCLKPTLRNLLGSHAGRKTTLSFAHSLLHSLNPSSLSIYSAPSPVPDTGCAGADNTKLLPTRGSHSCNDDISGRCSVSTGFTVQMLISHNPQDNPREVLYMPHPTGEDAVSRVPW